MGAQASRRRSPYRIRPKCFTIRKQVQLAAIKERLWLPVEHD
jgi:hypothetical protein